MKPSQLPPVDLLLQFSEESGELIQAISKLIRKERGNNPTPVTLYECREILTEELADVLVSLDVLAEHWDIKVDDLAPFVNAKKARWQERLSQ